MGTLKEVAMRPANTASQSLIVLPIATALGVLLVYVVRDGFQVGDLVGAVVTGIVAYLVLLVVRRTRRG